MAEALLRALLGRAVLPPGAIVAFDKAPDRLAQVVREWHINPGADNADVMRRAEVVILAVKPQDMPGVLRDIGPEATARHLVLSIAAGVTLATLEGALPAARVIRVMPNTPALVAEMAAGFALGSGATAKDAAVVRELLTVAGMAVDLPESLLDAVTGLSGSGPAFVAYFIESLARAGAAQGLEPGVASTLAVQTVLGTARLLRDRALTPDQLIAMVSSPNGTTIAGRQVLEVSDFQAVVAATVAAATRRSRELGQGAA